MEQFDLLSVACGGGRNSAMILGMYEHQIKPDMILFADTKGEKPETRPFRVCALMGTMMNKRYV